MRLLRRDAEFLYSEEAAIPVFICKFLKLETLSEDLRSLDSVFLVIVGLAIVGDEAMKELLTIG